MRLRYERPGWPWSGLARGAALLGTLVGLVQAAGCGDCRRGERGYGFNNGDRCRFVLDDEGQLLLTPGSLVLRPQPEELDPETGESTGEVDVVDDSGSTAKELVVQGYLDKEAGSPADGYEVRVEATPCSMGDHSEELNPSDYLALEAVAEGNCEQFSEVLALCRLDEDGIASLAVRPKERETPGENSVCIIASSGTPTSRTKVSVSYGFVDGETVRFTPNGVEDCGDGEGGPCGVPVAALDTRSCGSGAPSCDQIFRSVAGSFHVLDADGNGTNKNFPVFADLSVLAPGTAQVGLLGGIRGSEVACGEGGEGGASKVLDYLPEHHARSVGAQLCVAGAVEGKLSISTEISGVRVAEAGVRATETEFEISPQPARLEVDPVECEPDVTNRDCYIGRLSDCRGIPIVEPFDVIVVSTGDPLSPVPVNGQFDFDIEQQADGSSLEFEVSIPAVGLTCSY
jgi:hypothetical protein